MRFFIAEMRTNLQLACAICVVIGTMRQNVAEINPFLQDFFEQPQNTGFSGVSISLPQSQLQGAKSLHPPVYRIRHFSVNA